MRSRPSGAGRGAVLSLLIGIFLVATACAKGTTTLTSSGKKDAKIAAEVPASIRSKGSVTVASDASYAPMEFFGPDNKTIEGADVDIGTAIGDILGLKFNFVNATFDTIIPGLQSGKFDVGISSFFDTKDRQKKVDMIDYFQAGSGIFVPSSDQTTYTSLDQFCGKSVAAESGTTELSDATAASKTCQSEGKPAIKVLSFTDQNGVNLAVTSARAVAGLADSEVAAYQTKVTNGKLRFGGEYAKPVLYGMAIPRPTGSAPGSGPLTKAISDALTKLIADGTYGTILAKWGIQAGALTTITVNGATS